MTLRLTNMLTRATGPASIGCRYKASNLRFRRISCAHSARIWSETAAFENRTEPTTVAPLKSSHDPSHCTANPRGLKLERTLAMTGGNQGHRSPSPTTFHAPPSQGSETPTNPARFTFSSFVGLWQCDPARGRAAFVDRVIPAPRCLVPECDGLGLA